MKSRVPRRKGGRRNAKKALKKRVSNMNANSFSTRAVWNAGLTLTAGNVGTPVLNYVYGSGSALQGVWSVQQTREYAVYSKLFDQFRVTGVTLRYIPRANVQSINEAVAQNQANLNAYNNTIYSSYDVDSAIPSSLQPIQTMRSTRKHSFMKKWSRSFRYTYKDNTWLDTDLDYSGTKLSNFLAKGLYANFGFYGENLAVSPANSPPTIAQLEVIYHIVFRGQRLVNVSQDESGNIVLGTPEPDMKPLSEFTLLSGLKSNDDINECDLPPEPESLGDKVV